MKMNDFEFFMLKKSLILFLFLTIIISVLSDSILPDVLSFLSGFIIGCIKLLIMGNIFSNLLNATQKRKKLLPYVFGILIALTSMAILLSGLGGIRFFVFFTAGVLLVNFSVFINSITELLGITKNNFK